jgi:hypothetical protein
MAFLKGKRPGIGTWMPGSHEVGGAALPGLTLLECGVPAHDPAVSQAAEFVRTKEPHLTATYDLSLAILFLDRLVEPDDRDVIPRLALRLVAGQNPDGGWAYQCPNLSPEWHNSLQAVLENMRPQSPADLLKPLAVSRVSTPKQKAIEEDPTDKLVRRASLPPELRNLPVLQDELELRPDSPRGPSDNSNSQFAILALLAARRHGVPVERTLALVVKRYQASQNPEGGWGYHTVGSHFPAGPQSMICVGLLGLAVGHGLFRENRPADDSVHDPQIQRALRALGSHIGRRDSYDRNHRLPNLYFLWSLERVGVLYGLRTIDEKDWYAWGAELLVAHQRRNGAWEGGHYPGSTEVIDTCFALLFLKRANLARDLSKKIEFLKFDASRRK